MKQAASRALLPGRFLLDLILNPEDGDGMFLRSVD
jgi:hypothetical protein